MIDFLIGFTCGIIAIILISMAAITKAKKKLKNKLETLRKKLNMADPYLNKDLKSKLEELSSRKESIKNRLIKAQEITQRQLDMKAQTDLPSKNSMHSRYKNGLITEINKLEQEKRELLESILNDGFDPVVTALDEYGNQRSVNLSEFLNKAPPPSEEEKSEQSERQESKLEVKQYGKFAVIRGGKDEGNI